MTKVLNSVIHPQFSRLKEPAGRREDRPTRGEAQPQHRPPQRMRGWVPNQESGRVQRGRRTDLLLVRRRAETGGSGFSSLPLRLIRRLRILYGPPLLNNNINNLSTRGETVCR